MLRRPSIRVLMVSVATSFRPHFKSVIGVVGLAVISAVASQPAEAVTLTFTFTDVPILCPAGTCTYDVLTTSDIPPGTGSFPAPAITYSALTTLPLNGYSYQYIDTATAALFANAYNSSTAAPVLKTANNGTLGAKPSTPGSSGGPLFFIRLQTRNFGPNSLTQAIGQFYTTTTAVNFASNISGTGSLSGVTPQLQVWSIFKCTSGSCAPTPAPSSSVPGPLPLLGVGAAFGCSRRLRQRITRLQG